MEISRTSACCIVDTVSKQRSSLYDCVFSGRSLVGYKDKCRIPLARMQFADGVICTTCRWLYWQYLAALYTLIDGHQRTLFCPSEYISSQTHGDELMFLLQRKVQVLGLALLFCARYHFQLFESDKMHLLGRNICHDELAVSDENNESLSQRTVESLTKRFERLRTRTWPPQPSHISRLTSTSYIKFLADQPPPSDMRPKEG